MGEVPVMAPHSKTVDTMKNEHVCFNTRKNIRIITTLLLITGTLYLLTRLFMPKYDATVIEGALIAEYYGEEKGHDLIIIGDCEVYANFSPAVLWREFGINSYIRGSAQQLIWQSHYLLEDTLNHERPPVVLFNVLSLMYDEPQREAYNRMSLEGMRWSGAKVRAIRASMMAEEQFLDYVFPILRYHSRWSELSAQDVSHMFRTDTVSHNGMLMDVGVRPVEFIPEPRLLANYDFGENARMYLDKMRELCHREGIELILIKAPSLYPHWYDEWEAQVVAYATEHDLAYINFLDLVDEIGIDFATDTFDAGLHMNLAGAEKLSLYLGEYLLNETVLADRRGEPALAAIWDGKLARYDAERQRLEGERDAE